MAKNDTYFSFLNPYSAAAPTVPQMPTPARTPSASQSPSLTPNRGSSGYSAGYSGYSPAGRTSDIWPFGLPGTTGPGGTVGSNGLLIPTAGANPDKPVTSEDFNLIKKIIDPVQHERIGGLGSDFDALRTEGNTSLEDFSKSFLSNSPVAKRYLGEETGAIGRYYSSGPGSVEFDQERLRQDAFDAAVTEGRRGFDYADRGIKSNQLMAAGGGGSGNSWVNRNRYRVVSDIMSKVALENAAQAQRDFQYREAGKLSQAGARSRLMDEYDRRTLVPTAAKEAWLRSLTGNARSIGDARRDEEKTGLSTIYNPNVESWFDGGGGGGRGGSPSGGRSQPYSFGGPRPGAPGSTVRPGNYAPGSSLDRSNPASQMGGYYDGRGVWMVPDGRGGWIPGQRPVDQRFQNQAPNVVPWDPIYSNPNPSLGDVSDYLFPTSRDITPYPPVDPEAGIPVTEPWGDFSNFVY